MVSTQTVVVLRVILDKIIRTMVCTQHVIMCVAVLFLVRASAWLNTWSCPSVRSSVRPPVRLFQLAYCLNDQAHFAWFTLWVPRGQLRGRRGPSMEDTLSWKTTFFGRRHPMEDNLLWKTPLIKDNIRGKTTFDRGQHLKEDIIDERIFLTVLWTLNFWNFSC